VSIERKVGRVKWNRDHRPGALHGASPIVIAAFTAATSKHHATLEGRARNRRVELTKIG